MEVLPVATRPFFRLDGNGADPAACGFVVK